MTLSVGGLGVDKILEGLRPDEKRGARTGAHAGGEYIVNRYWNNGSIGRGWCWGYQANYRNGCCACGPFRFRWTAELAARRELRRQARKE